MQTLLLRIHVDGQTPLLVAASFNFHKDVETLLWFVDTASRDRLRYEVSRAEAGAVFEKYRKVVRSCSGFTNFILLMECGFDDGYLDCMLAFLM